MLNYVITAAVAAGVAFGAAWQTQEWRWGEKTQATEADRLRRSADHLRGVRMEEHARTKKLLEAINARTKRNNTLAATNAALDDELGGLRNDLELHRSLVASLSADASAERIATLNGLLERCASRYSRVAKAASGHASDSLMYQEGWPK